MSGCAVGHDGQLLDASEIIFYNDVDDDAPISGLPSSSNASAPLHPIFTGLAPAIKIAGARRTNRISRPSMKARDPDNAEASVLPIKRQSRDKQIARRIPRKTISDTSSDSDKENTDPRPADHEDTNEGADEFPPLLDADDSDDEGDEKEGDGGHGDETEMDVDDAEEAYALTKNMGDSDRQVTFHAALFFLLTNPTDF
jgi:hypothetical protein